jgi:hypothetical protein
MVTARMLLGDNAGAISHLEGFFTDQFLDQIAASGEQPLEAVRTRPWHYRCFNMEALIASLPIECWDIYTDHEALTDFVQIG